jgi:hypothetical protein
VEATRRIEQLFSDAGGPCPECGQWDLSRGDPDLAAVTNHMIEDHGWELLHIGQQSTTNYRGELLQQTTVILGEPVFPKPKHLARASNGLGD